MAVNTVKTLTEKQQRNSLLGNKSGKGCNRSVRLVLAKPYSGFWPLVDTEVESEVTALLENFLPAVCKPITPDDRKVLRGMLGKKGKDARNALTRKIWERSPQAIDLRNSLIIGVNNVSRSLEENTLASLLISNEADPPILTKHLATLAATRKVPHIVLRNLKVTMKKCVDFSSLAVGFKKVVAEDDAHHFHTLHLKIDEVFKTLVKPILSNIPNEETLPPSADVCSPIMPKVQSQSPPNLYLTRSSSNYRAFVPGKGLQVRGDSSWSPYISLSDSAKMSPAAPVTQSSKVLLASTIVPEAKSFLQKVREAKKALIQPSTQGMTTGSFLSISNNEADNQEELVAQPEQPAKAPKPVRRYFSTLAPLKVKRMQGNPHKDKKKGKM